MKIKKVLFSSFLAFTIVTALNAATTGAKTVVVSAFDTMKYSVTKIEAHPGEKIVVELKNEGNVPKEAMGHNWILLKAGIDPLSYANAAMTAKAEGYEPKSHAGDVLASIRVLGPKESAKASFTAPSAPGTYVYLCSFPAHFQAGMKGILVVK